MTPLLTSKKTSLILFFCTVVTSTIAIKKSSNNSKLNEQLQKVIGEKFILEEQLAQVNNSYENASNKNKKLYKKVIAETNHIISLKNSVNELDENLKIDKETLSENIDIAQSLQNKNKVLSEEINKAKKLTANSLKTTKVRKKASGKFIKTTNSNKIDGFKINFQIQENNLAEAGEKKIQIQLINPKDQIVALKKTSEINGKKINCSDEFSIDYNNELINVISLIEVNRDNLISGIYEVKAYINGNFVASNDFTIAK